MLFEKGIFDLANDTSEIARNVAWPFTRIFSYIMTSIQSHYDPNDGFSVLNLKEGELFAFKHRFQQVFEGFFKGNMPDNDDFEIMNPLIENSLQTATE